MQSSTLVPPVPNGPDFVSAVRENVSLFGESDPSDGQIRVAVPLSLCLTFHDLVGLLAYHPDALPELEYEELDHDDLVRDALCHALADSTADQTRQWSAMVREDLSDPGQPLNDFASRIGRAVTRTFGVTA